MSRGLPKKGVRPLRQNAQMKKVRQRSKDAPFPYFSRPFFFRHFSLSFDIIQKPINHYKELFTFSTGFSTAKKSSIHRAFLDFFKKLPPVEKRNPHPVSASLFIDITLFFTFFCGENFFSLSIMHFVS